jgi:hypothetical protein
MKDDTFLYWLLKSDTIYLPGVIHYVSYYPTISLSVYFRRHIQIWRSWFLGRWKELQLFLFFWWWCCGARLELVVWFWDATLDMNLWRIFWHTWLVAYCGVVIVLSQLFLKINVNTITPKFAWSNCVFNTNTSWCN